MAYDEGMAERIRAMFEGDPDVAEKKMFGGVAFLLGGRMFIGIVKGDLMVRVGRSGHDGALKHPHARTMDFTGRPMIGYVFVSPEGTADDADLARWVGLGRSVAMTLGEKPPGRKKAARTRSPATARRSR